MWNSSYYCAEMTKLSALYFGRFCFLLHMLLYGTCVAKDLKLGVLIPCTQSRPVGPFMASAILLGLDTVQKNNILTNVNITWTWKDSFCKGLRSNKIVWDWWEKNEADAIIGPVCCIVSEEIGSFLGAVNIPFISYGCSSSYLMKKPDFPTFSSVVGNTIEPVAAIFVLIAQTFKWKNIAVVTTMESDHMRSISNIVREKLLEGSTNIRAYYIQTTVAGNDEKFDLGRLEKMKRIVTMTKTEAAVIFLLMYNSDVINFLHLALKEEMCDGSYIFVTTEMSIVNPRLTSLPYSSEDIRRSLNGLLSIEMKAPMSDRWMKFAAKVVQGLDDPEFKDKFDKFPHPSKEQVHPLAGLLHDAVLLWALAINHTMRRNENTRDGVTVTRKIQGVLARETLLKRFSIMPTERKRAVVYGLSILKFGYFVELFYYNSSTKQLIQSPYTDELMSSVIALHDHLKEFPECGHNNEFCPSEPSSAHVAQSNSTVFIVLGTIIVISAMAVVFVLVARKHFTKWKVLNTDGWKINRIDIVDGGALLMEQLACIAKRTYWPLTDDQKNMMKHLEISVGNYKDKPVAVKHLRFDLIDIKDEAVISEMEQMLEMKNLNINEFYGVCLDAPVVWIVTKFAPKGSLWDLIRFKDFSLPVDFKVSFAIDVASGMRYLHQTPLGSHGHLTSTNCLVDNTWTCKVADFGLSYLRQMQTFHSNSASHQESRNPSAFADTSSFESLDDINRLKPLWTSPELLRIPDNSRPTYGTPAGDVYSYGIILQELILKGSPFANELEQLSVEEIVRRVRCGDGEILRPYVSSVNCPNPIWNSVMVSCWSEDINSRPDFASVLQMWRQTNDGKQVLAVDKMLKLLQDHNEHLDNLVTQRKLQLAAEKKRLEYLVERMLPRSIIEQLNTGKNIVPEEFSDVTIFISDIVAFTELSANCEPEEVVALLSNLYTLFDNVMDKFDVYKVEIIGDAYIAASGVPQPNYHHASEIGKMALQILNSISEFKMPTKPDRKIKIRIGVHSGPVVGGIVGKKMPHYCLFGDTLVTAGILETSCSPMHIHISEATNQLLEKSNDRFSTAYRGKLMLPAKGEIKTYYIVGLENFHLPLPPEMVEDLERKQSLILVDMDYRLVTDHHHQHQHQRARIPSLEESENYEVFQSNDSRRFSGDAADRAAKVQHLQQQQQHQLEDEEEDGQRSSIVIQEELATSADYFSDEAELEDLFGSS